MFKKLFVFFFCFLLVLCSVSSAFADDEEFQHYVVADENYIIETFFSNYDFENLSDEFISAIRSHVTNYPDEIQILYLNSTGLRIQCCRNDTYLQDLKFSLSDDSALYGCFRVDFNYHSFENNFRYSMNASQHWYQLTSDYLTCTNESSLSSYIYNMSASYKNSTNSSSYRPFWQTSFYDGNILQAILDYYDVVHGIQQQFYDVDDVSGTYIKYYSAFDSYKGMYNEKFFGDDDIRNYLNSSVVFDDSLVDVYYSSDVDSVDTSDYYQHREDLTFYVQFKDETTHNSLSALSDRTTIMNLMNSCTSVKHYTDNVISFSVWFNALGIDYYINSRHQFQFTMSNSYTYMNTLFQGSKVVTTAKLIVNNDNAFAGFGRLSDSDLDNNKSFLRNQGWSNGYPNNFSYPYRVDIYKNNEKYLQIYFSSKPLVSSYFYTDSQIRFDIDLTNNSGYFYLVKHNLSISFNFAELEKVDKSILIAILEKMSADKYISLVDLQAYLNDRFSRSVIENMSLPADVIYNLVKHFLELNNDIYNVLNKKLVIWTNYTGDINRANWVGYHCRFNWDVDVDGSFIRGNSDDTHNYHNDVVKDILSDTEIATEVSTSIDEQGNIISSYNTTYNYYNYYYNDNNGNTHGGGDNTYIATEPSTASELIYQNAVSDFDFNAPTLWNYASSAMNFCKSAFTVFPGFIWLLIASGIVLVIALRLLGR